MPRHLLAALLAALSFIVVEAPVLPAYADDAQDCIRGSGDARVRGCSRIIETRRLLGEPISEGNLAIAYSNRGDAYFEKRQYDRAIADYDRAIEHNPRYAVAYNNRGNAYSDRGEYDRAIADYDSAIGLDPKFAVAYNNRGNAYSDRGEYDRAIADYDAAIGLDPGFALAYNNRGNAYSETGRRQRAIADYRSALELDASIEESRKALERLTGD